MLSRSSFRAAQAARYRRTLVASSASSVPLPAAAGALAFIVASRRTRSCGTAPAARRRPPFCASSGTSSCCGPASRAAAPSTQTTSCQTGAQRGEKHIMAGVPFVCMLSIGFCALQQEPLRQCVCFTDHHIPTGLAWRPRLLSRVTTSLPPHTYAAALQMAPTSTRASRSSHERT